jgi:hypothetical protein
MAGATSLTVTDPTGIVPGGEYRIWEPGAEETVTVSTLWVPPDPTVPTVPTTVLLAAATVNAHETGHDFSSLPADARNAIVDPGARTGSQIVAWVPRTSEQRFAVAGEHGGMKNVRYEVELAVYIRSRTPHAEDAQDDVYALREALVDHMRADRTLGGACFEAGEAIDGGRGSIDVDYGQPETKAGLTKSFFLMSFTALEIVQA